MRIANPYGEGQAPFGAQGVIAAFLARALSGDSLNKLSLLGISLYLGLPISTHPVLTLSTPIWKALAPWSAISDSDKAAPTVY